MDAPQPHLNKQESLDKQPPPKSGWRYIIVGILIIILIIILALVLRACMPVKQPPKAPIPIVTAVAHTDEVPVYIPALGTVTATYTITVKTQVNGVLEKVLYQEGQIVKKGDLLAEIDPRPFLAQLTEFEGQLKRDTAQLENAKVDLKRYQQLYPQGAVSAQVYATQAALVKQLEGTVQFDQGQIEAVKVNLIYTRIISPINGRVGLRLVDPGNFVQTSDTTGLLVINTVQPITVIFAIPEDDIHSVITSPLKGKPLLVKAYDRTQNTLLSTGTLLTIDNQINTTTGTVNLRAQFPNQNLRLFPNQFVNIQLLVNILPQAVVIPTAAIQQGQQGPFVFLLNQNQTVSVKPVTTSVVFGENTVITNGVTAGQQVVVQGADQLSDGSAVSISSGVPAAGNAT